MKSEDPQERPDTALGAGSKEGGQSDDVDREHSGQYTDAQGRLRNSRGEYARQSREEVVDKQDDDVPGTQSPSNENDDAPKVEDRPSERPMPQQIDAFLGTLTQEDIGIVERRLKSLQDPPVLSIEYLYLLFKGTGHASCRRNCQSIKKISTHKFAVRHFGASLRRFT